MCIIRITNNRTTFWRATNELVSGTLSATEDTNDKHNGSSDRFEESLKLARYKGLYQEPYQLVELEHFEHAL